MRQLFRKGSFRRISALMKKEFYQIIRDPSSILIGFVMPLILLFLYGYGISLDLNKLNIGVVMEDTSPDAQSFLKALSNSTYFNVTVARDRRELDESIVRGSIRGIVVIPSYFSQFKEQAPEHTGPIQVIADGSEPNTAAFVQNYVLGVWQKWISQELISEAKRTPAIVSLEPRFWYNEELESRFFLVPGILALVMTLIGTLLTALVVAREWERGTMEALMSTPVSIVELLVGKLIPYFILGMASMAMCVMIAITLYHVPFRGSLLILTLVSALYIATALGLGLLISTVTRDQFVAAQISQVAAFLPAFMLSGFIFEISSMPWYIQIISALVPARYFVSSLQTLFLVGDVWSLIIFNCIPIIAIGLFLFMVTARISVKRLD